MMVNIVMNVSVNDITAYFQLLTPHLTIDNKDFFCYEFSNIEEYEDIYNILRDDFKDLPFLDYYIQYFSSSYSSIENFKEDIQYVYNGDLDKSKITIKITIDKSKFIKYYNSNQPNFFIFSNIKSFVKTFSKDKTFDFSRLTLNEKIKIFILNCDIDFQLYNNYLSILNISKIETASKESIPPFAIEKYNSIQNIFDYKKIDFYTDIPHFWNFNFTESDTEHFNLMKQSILTFFSLVSNKELGNSNTFLIRGYHNLEFTIDDEFSFVNSELLIELIDFTLDLEKHYDKVLILRSVITTYLNNYSTTEHFCTQLVSIFESTKYQFSMYVQNEVKIFIEQKNQVLNETHNLARQISTLTSEVTNSLRNAIVSLLATLIASSIPDIGEKLDNKLILEVLCGVFILYLGTSLYNVFITHSQLNGALDNFKNYLKHISSQSLNGLDYESLKRDFFQNQINNFNKTKYLSITIYILLLICTFYILLKLFKLI